MDTARRHGNAKGFLSLFSSAAFSFVFTMGVVNLFADMTYEGGGSINGPFLGSLGASAAAVAVIAGVGEFLGYSLRIVSGYLADKTGKYWLTTFIGYGVNLLAVPALALTRHWPAAAALILAERIGRAIRKPTVEAMLSYTTGELGKGWVYALNTALDETGATIGPLLMALVIYLKAGYHTGYALLLLPALLALASVVVARVVFPLPARLEKGRTASATGFTRAYWLYMAAGACLAAGIMSFEFISYHWARNGTVTGFWIPVFVAFATVVGIAASLILGKLYDRIGIGAVLIGVFLSSLFAPLAFFGNFSWALLGMLLWGVGYATQDTLLKALIASVLPEGKRNFAFGLFYVGYGGGWLIGSMVSGLLYSRSIPLVVAFSVLVQFVSLPLFFFAKGGSRTPRR